MTSRIPTDMVADRTSKAKLSDTLGSMQTSINTNTSSLAEMMLNAKHPPIPLVALKGDGTDEGSNIQALLNYCETNQKNIFFPKGTYGTSISLTFSGRFTIRGERGSTEIKALSTMDKLLTWNNDFTNLTNDNVFRVGQMLDITINGDSKANTVLYLYQGKNIIIRGSEFTRPLVQAVLIGNTGTSTYEVIMDDCLINATNDSGQAQYAMVINQLSDSWFSKLLLINGSVNWINITGISSSSFHQIHAYAYPQNFAPDTGYNVNSSGDVRFYDLVADTPKRVGMNITGNGVTIRNFFAGLKQGYVDTGSNDIAAVTVSGNLHDFDNVEISQPDSTQATRTNVIVFDNTSQVYDFRCGTVRGWLGTTLNKDLKIKGNAPLRFSFPGGTQSTTPYRQNNVEFFNNTVYIGGTTLPLTFTNPRQTTTYKVDVNVSWNTTWWITNKTTNGFTVNFGTAPTANGVVDVYVPL